MAMQFGDAGISRRSFLGTAGLAAGALFLAGCGTQPAASQEAASAASSGSTEDAAVSSGLALFQDRSSAGTTDDVASFYGHVRSVTALARTYPAGEKVIGAAIEYDAPLDAASLDAGGGGIQQQAIQQGLGTYYVLGRTISALYVSDAPELSEEGGSSSGTYAIIELDPRDAGAQTLLFQMSRGQVGSNGPVELGTDTLRICQVKDISSSSGAVFAGDATMTRYMVSSSTSNAQTAGYVAGTFDDEATGCHAAFELLQPAGYDSSKSYPLVLFLPDAGVTTSDPEVNLRQGPGAVAWNDEEAYVLTVAGTTVDVETCLDLVDSLADEGYTIDRDRIYGTGESAGCMALISYAAEHADDDRFAAYLFVAGQGDMAQIKQTPFIAFASEDDESSYGGLSDPEKGIPAIDVPYVEAQLDCTYDFDGEGHTSGRWVDYAATGESNPSGNQEGARAADSDRTLDELMADLSAEAASTLGKADAEGAHIVFFHIAEGTLDGTDSSIQGGNTHNFTWQYAYSIPEIRSWILSQQR